MSKKNRRFEDKIYKILADIDLKINNEALLICSEKISNSFLLTSNSNIDKQTLLGEHCTTYLNSINVPKMLNRKNSIELFLNHPILVKHPFITSIVVYPLEVENKLNVGYLLAFNGLENATKQKRKIQNELNLLSIQISEAIELDNLTYYENIFNISSEMVCVAGMDGYFKKINPAFRRKLLWSEEELLSRDVNEFVHPLDQKELKKRVRAINCKTKSLDINIRLKQKNGSYKMIEWVISIDPFKKLIYGIGRDITNIENTKHELIRAKEMLENTNKVAMIGGWEYIVESGSLYWTSISKQIHGLSDDSNINLTNALSFYPEGESLNKINEALDKALKEGVPYDIELEIVTAKDKNKWVRAIGKPHFENGECLKITGTFQDIDKDKKNRIALEVINSRMEAVLNASTETSIIATDLNGRITHFNTGSENLLGYTAKEIIGIYTPIIFYSVEELENQAKENSILFNTTFKPGIDSYRIKSKMGMPDNGEFTYITRDLEKRNVKVSVTP
jgi:PAS domain S-box-containing protein